MLARARGDGAANQNGAGLRTLLPAGVWARMAAPPLRVFPLARSVAHNTYPNRRRPLGTAPRHYVAAVAVWHHISDRNAAVTALLPAEFAARVAAGGPLPSARLQAANVGVAVGVAELRASVAALHPLPTRLAALATPDGFPVRCSAHVGAVLVLAARERQRRAQLPGPFEAADNVGPERRADALALHAHGAVELCISKYVLAAPGPREGDADAVRLAHEAREPVGLKKTKINRHKEKMKYIHKHFSNIFMCCEHSSDSSLGSL